MGKVLISAELDYDGGIVMQSFNGDEHLFFSEILSQEKGLLLVHSNKIAQGIGKLKVLSVEPISNVGDQKPMTFNDALNEMIKREAIKKCAELVTTLSAICNESPFGTVEKLTGYLWSEQTEGLIKEELRNGLND